MAYKRRFLVKIGNLKFNGGCSSIGRASGCGPESRGFKPRHSPHLVKCVRHSPVVSAITDPPSAERSVYYRAMADAKRGIKNA